MWRLELTVQGRGSGLGLNGENEGRSCWRQA